MQFVEPEEQLEFFHAQEKYSQEPPLTEIKNLEKLQIIYWVLFYLNNPIFDSNHKFFV